MLKMNTIALVFLAFSKYNAKTFLSNTQSKQNKLMNEVLEDLSGEKCLSGFLLEYFVIIEYFPHKYNYLKNTSRIKIINSGESMFLTLGVL
jgi:hypothetical protein